MSGMQDKFGAKLQASFDDADASRSNIEVFKELSAQLDAQLEKMKQTLNTELPRLNAALKREKIEAVDPAVKPPAPTAKPK